MTDASPDRTGGRLGVFVTTLESPTLRRIGFAFLAFSVSEWATWLAMVVYAYGRGGPSEAGIVAFVQLVPSIALAPLASSLGDRLPRARVLTWTYLVQAAALGLVAAALVAGAAPLIVYAAATLAATSITLTRPIQASLLPEVAATPDELTAANALSGAIEGAGSLVGPLAAGVLLGVGGPGLVFAAAALGVGTGAVAVAPVARTAADPVEDRRGELEPAGSAMARVREDAIAGLATIAREPRLRAVVGLLTCSMLLLGALDIFYAVLAFEVLALGEGGVGFLGAATGLGALVGATSALSLVGRERLVGPFLWAAMLFGGSLAAVALAPGPVAAMGLLASAGAGSALVYVGAQTLVQRLAGDDVMSRVFGVVEALMMAATAVGGLLVPVLVALVGPGGSLVVAGAVLPLGAALAWRTLAPADRAGIEHREALRVLRRVPMLAPLSAPVIERLAAGAIEISAPAGAAIVREGERGDRFYVIAAGRVSVTVAGREVRVQGPGEGFGEIALLRDVSRTATVTALDDVRLVAVEREPFLAALTGQPRSRRLAARLVEERVGAAAGGR